MAQYHSPENGYQLNIDSRYYSTLDIEGFSQMMKDPSYCYKFYWLEAIVGLISEGVTRTTFNEIIDEMICNAWYSVREFHIHLRGLGDGVPGQLVQRLAVFPRQVRHDASPALLMNSSTSSRWSSGLISRSTMRPAMSAAMPEISPISSE